MNKSKTLGDSEVDIREDWTIVCDDREEQFDIDSVELFPEDAEKVREFRKLFKCY